MDADKLKEITDNPDFVSGIHDYCDRWCERCPYTMRCSVYAIEQEELCADEGAEDEQQVTLDKLQSMLRLSMAMVREQAEEAGIDLEAVTEEDKAAVRAPRQEAKEHPCVKQAVAYREAVGLWLKRVQPALKEKGQAMETEARLELPGQDVETEFSELKDAFAIIQWYYLFIGVKLVRAASQIPTEDPDQIEHQQTDQCGTAKVALVAMDRSLAAWTQLRNHLPDEGDNILDFLVQLERLRKATEAWLPEARAFVRPGLDEAEA
ncbi:hypothetical protein ACFL6U_13650 [Planctomycetota bacterium]